jgi:hypothetical protein
MSRIRSAAQFVLTDAGVVRPTTADLSAALVGGVVVAPSGKTIALPGVLKQRAAGMAWSDIAQRYGTTMRAFNRGGSVARDDGGGPGSRALERSGAEAQRPVVRSHTRARAWTTLRAVVNPARRSLRRSCPKR